MIGSSSTGSSFTGLAGYLLGDESRVGWAETVNLHEGMDGGRVHLGQEMAARVAAEMRDQAAGSARVKAPVYHVALAFDPDDRPTEDELRGAARRTLRDLGLDDHQALIVRHTDQKHAHIHLMVNRVGPDGRAWSTSHERRRLRASVEAQERELGVRWTGRNAAAARTDTSRGDPARDPTRDPTRSAGQGFAADVRSRALGDFERASGWPDLAARLETTGLRVERRGRGAVVTDGKQEAKLSSVSRQVSLSKLEARFGPLQSLGRAGRKSATAEAPAGRPRRRSFAASRQTAGRVLRQSTGTVARGASRIVRSVDMDGERGADERMARAAVRSVRRGASRAAVRVVREAVYPLGGRTLAERSLGGRVAHRDIRPGGRIDRLAALVAEHARLHRLGAQWGTVLGVRTRAQEAATARVASLHARSERAAETFSRSVSSVYADPRAASRAFLREAGESGGAAAARKMASSPESFGPLRATTPDVPAGLRGLFLRRPPPSTEPARAAATEAATAGAAYVRARGEHLAATRGPGVSGRGTDQSIWVQASERREARVRAALFPGGGAGPAEKSRLDDRIGRAFARVGQVPTRRLALTRPHHPERSIRLANARQAARVTGAVTARLGTAGLGVALAAVRSVGRGLSR